ncbi:Pfs NACHT and WD domain protein [Penicillium odoratum]|uniref:Pfs NACHT and WD domain protein n=1 Tax=Penicillium odoratum TaxID=1167516 RepID=UPI002549407D|nr:Pfs NACHT and WD domain protein [Penicillium odoratum]KAJ5776942.1 Pfs NACHT and WD domain protein [Penicillium odoratum]
MIHDSLGGILRQRWINGHVTLHSDIVSESISAAPITKQSNSTTKFSGDNNGGFQLGANNGTIRDIVFSNKADDNCLKDLRLTDPRDDRKRITVTKGGLLEGSSKWILDHPDFRRWRDDDQSRLLWIKGDPGKGKTMLLIGIIDELERQAVQPRLAGQSTFHATVLTYFFCQGTDSNLNNATAVLRGLIFLLAIQQPLLASHLRKEYEHSGNKLFEGGNTFFALSRVLSGMLQDPTLERTYIIIDALDECETGLQQLLNLFVENTSASRVKWIVSSRNSPEVELELHDSHIKLSLEFKANAEHVSRAVGVYIDEKVLQLKSIRDNDVRQQVKNILRQKAGGTFLWAALVIKELEQAKPWDVLPVLEEVPTGLEELYARMVEKIQQLKRDNPVYCRLMLSAAILANRPLHLLELAVLSRLPKDISSNSETVREFLIMCGSFLIIQDDRVYIIHQSAKNYLSDKATAIIFPSGRPEAHHNMFLRSMQAMSVTLKRDVYGLRHPGFLIDDLRIPVLDPLASIRYSCIHWVDHLIKYCHGNNAIEELQESGLIARFFCQDYLHWLEALSLSRSLFEGIASLLKLESFLKTLEGHTRNVNSVLFSHDSQLLASASDDKTVKVWDASSGQCLQTLEGHTSNVNSITFSHDSQLLASASYDKTVKVWDASSGQCLQTLEGHTSSVNSVTFSHDSQLLASASYDKTVKVWDASSGQCLQTLEGHTSNVNSVTFSHDSQLLASASDDETVKVWDASSGQCLRTLEGHTDNVNSVTFSHDSQLLASASGDETVKVWDASSGQCLQTIVFNQVATIKSFDTHTGSIELDIGTTRLSSDSNSTPTIPNPQYPQFQGLGINSDRTWITWNSENLLWLPPEYRPVAYTVSLSKVTFGCSSGRVFFFNFNANIPSYFCAGS